MFSDSKTKNLAAILSVLTLGATLSFATTARAGDNVTEDQILRALTPVKKPLTRSLSGSPRVEPTTNAAEDKLVQTIRGRSTRSLSSAEREEIAAIVKDKPKIDLEIHFDYNSAEISKNSVQAVQELGKALSDPTLKGSTFVVAGHTDAVGGEEYNQGLSERRADTIKRYLTDKYGINGSDLVAVGYGKTKPKDANAPMDPTNRRVQVVNMDTKTASQ